MLRFRLSTGFVLVLCVFGIAIAGCAQTQKVKTVTLPSGEEVMDISGLWDSQIENYGSWSEFGKYSTETEIKQNGGTFVGVRLKKTPYHDAGSISFQGELDSNGIKKIQLITGYGPMDANGEISEDGKTIKFDIPDKGRGTMIRKE